jgi:hypothetical protein
MKIAEYKQMMEYLTRPGFNGGGSVRNKTILPKKKPEEEVKKRKIKNFEKAKPALENPKEVKEMINKPKRGLVDGPGSYAGEQAKGIYTLDELANLEINPYGPDGFKSLVRGGSGKTKEQINKFNKMLKDSGAELFPRKEGGSYKYKIKDMDKLIKGVTNYALASPKSKPKIFTDRYYEEVPKTFKELVKKGEPFSKEDLKRKVLLNLKDFPYQMKDTALDDVITRTISKKEQKKFTYGGDLKSLQVTKGKQDIYENVLKGNTNIKNLMKATGQSKKEIERNLKNLMYSLYETRGAIGAKEDLSNIDRKNKINVFLRNENLKNIDKAIDNIIDEPTLKTSRRDTLFDIIYDAIGNPKNKKTYQPERYKRMTERLRSFYSLNDALTKKFPEFDLRLDHGLSKAAIKAVIGTGDKTKFINVAPLSEELNAGLKKSFDVQYKTILENIQDDSKRADRTKFLKQKVVLEKLAKNIGLPFGTISPGGQKKFTSGTLEQQDLPKNIKKAITIKNNIIENIKKIPDLEQQFKIAFEGTKTNALETLNNLKKDKNIPRVLSFLKMLIKKRPGLRADIPEGSFDFLNKISDAIVSPVAAAEVLPGEAQAATPKPMNFDLDMSLPKPPESLKYLPDYSDAALVGAGTIAASKFTKPDPFKKVRRFPKKVGSGILRGATAIEAPALALPQSAFQAGKLIGDVKRGEQTDVGAADITLPTSFSSLAASKKFGLDLFADNAGKLKKFLRAGLSPRAVSLLSKGSVYATPFIETAIQVYNAKKRLEEAKKKSSVFEPRVDTALGEAPESYYNEIMSEIPSEGRLKEFPIPFTDKKFTLPEVGVGEFAAAGGGIAKMAGKPSGPAPESGPTPQGLDFLMKRGR